jgi:hypothetical protein
VYDKEDNMWRESCLAKMRKWVSVFGKDLTIDGDLKLEMSGPENAAHLEIQPKSTLEKLLYGVMLKVCLQTMEGKRNQICIQLFEVNKIKQVITAHTKILHTELASLQSQNTQFEQVNQKLQQKVKIMMQIYPRNGKELSRKLVVEENDWLEIDEEVYKKMEPCS